MSTAKLSPVQFHGHTLFILSHNDEPYTPMKPIVESMGMDWKTQYRKILTNQDRWTVVKMTMVAKDGRNRDTLCLPLRMLPAFFATVQPNRIKDLATRQKIILFQKECDNALWDYWNNGIAINPRLALTPAQKNEIQTLVKSKVAALPDTVNSQKTYMEIWGRVKNKFKVGTYKEIDSNKFDELVTYVKAMQLNIAENLPLPIEPDPTSLFIDFLLQSQDKLSTPINQTAEKLRQGIVHKLKFPTSLNPAPNELAIFNNLVHSVDRSVRDVEDALLNVQAGLRDMESFVRMISKS
ncbi:phage antirepressor N-terminal domain-containing protein [Desulfovibrio gilichinskyi]|uniref:ORF6C domain-containing protein n=1 Tax=Desulfovibrio gilichinskyi TaxID=1519643 RepID=A0A1X7C3N2_9BACT|nr:phage antirepressor N-terminal domain-containing protein [Desulfovibrio gilichinskyi]SME89443.1 ORF6C domain-containing protein [Desulfovibrio gilichinskyi]